MGTIGRSPWQKLDLWARAAAPSLSLLVLVMLGVMPLQLPGYGAVAPLLPLIGVYYWILHRPDLITFPVLFVVGLFQDLLTGGPLGVSGFVFLTIGWLVLSQRRVLAGMPVLVVWSGFAMIAAVAVGLEWLIISGLYGEILPVRPAIYRALVTGAAYPIVAVCLHPVLRTMTPPPPSA